MCRLGPGFSFAHSCIPQEVHSVEALAIPSSISNKNAVKCGWTRHISKTKFRMHCSSRGNSNGIDIGAGASIVDADRHSGEIYIGIEVRKLRNALSNGSEIYVG